MLPLKPFFIIEPQITKRWKLLNKVLETVCVRYALTIYAFFKRFVHNIPLILNTYFIQMEGWEIIPLIRQMILILKG